MISQFALCEHSTQILNVINFSSGPVERMKELEGVALFSFDFFLFCSSFSIHSPFVPDKRKGAQLSTANKKTDSDNRRTAGKFHSIRGMKFDEDPC